jgi:SAM-dependent methyltransferase
MPRRRWTPSSASWRGTDSVTARDDAAAYDAWYDTPRGGWIGESEYRLAHRLLAPRPGETLLDAGCGTGWFSRRFAARGLTVTGLDPKADWLAFAHAKETHGIDWVEGDARRLPFPDAHFDLAVSIAALCFIDDERLALAEILRVTRRRFAIGWLNRSSVLYREKADRGAYRGAIWHTTAELRALFMGLPTKNLVIRSAVFLPGGGRIARLTERLMPAALPWGALLVAAGEIDVHARQ